MKDIYFQLISVMKYGSEINTMSKSGVVGVGWASSGGEATALFNEKYLAADGIDNVINVLEQVENGNIPPLEFIELNACTSGCVGGVLTIQNPFIARARLRSLRRYLPVTQNSISRDEKDYISQSISFGDLPEYRPISRLSDSMAESMRMMSEIQNLKKELPGIDCGSCGAPSCRAFAEDIVKGDAVIDDCLILKVKSCKGDISDDG